MPFITVTETVFEGRIAGWKDENEKPVLYETRQEAELDANDPEMLAMDNDPDDVVEVVVTEDRIYDPIDGRTYWEKK